MFIQCFASEQSQRALGHGVLRRLGLFGAALGQATEDGHGVPLDVAELRIEHRWHSHARFVWVAHAPMDNALLPSLRIAKPLYECGYVRCGNRWAFCCGELARAAAS